MHCSLLVDDSVDNSDNAKTGVGNYLNQMIYKSQFTSLHETACGSVAEWLAASILNVESNQNVESKTKNVESKIAFLLQEISYFEP